MSKSKKLKKVRTYLLADIGHYFLRNYNPEMRDGALQEMYEYLEYLESKIEKAEYRDRKVTDASWARLCRLLGD